MREYANISASFGKILRKARQQSGLSQETLSELARVDKSYISLLEHGKRQPSLTILFQLSDALNIVPTDFINAVAQDIPQNKNQTT
jgi:transcriptional regulator with XRE-family HTH domain